jgi:uncharacterized membrane protein
MSNPASTPENGSPETIVEMGRLNGLSDGVFAFALTLLVLDIRVPEDALAGDLGSKLLELAPRLLIYFISFIVIGGAWGSHQRMLSQIKRGDGLLVWFNLLSLLFVTLLPASAALLARFPGVFIALVCFAVDVILIQLTALWMWRHASQNGLVNPALDPRVVTGVGRRLILSAGGFAFSIPLALLNPNLAYILWIAVFLLLFTTDWLSWQQAARSTQATIPLEGATQGNISVIYGAGHLHIRAGAMNEVLVDGTFGGGLDTQITREGSLLKTQLSAPEKLGFMSLRYPWAWGPANALDWSLSLNPQIPLITNIETSAGDADLDFSELQVTDLNLKTSASMTNLSLPVRMGQTFVKIEGSAASFVIRVPPTVAVQIHMVKSLSSLELDPARFSVIQDGHEYRSIDYDTAANRVIIQVELSFGSVKIIQ